MAHGICLAAVGATQAHLSGAGFEHDGQKLRDLPNLRARLAEMSCRTEQSRALLGFTVQAMLAPDEQTPLYVLRSRLAAMEAALDVTDREFQVPFAEERFQACVNDLLAVSTLAQRRRLLHVCRVLTQGTQRYTDIVRQAQLDGSAVQEKRAGLVASLEVGCHKYQNHP